MSLLILIALAASTARFLWDSPKSQRDIPLETGLTPVEVKARLGEPERVTTIGEEEIWYYAHEKAYVSFKEGKSRSSNMTYTRPPRSLR